MATKTKKTNHLSEVSSLVLLPPLGNYKSKKWNCPVRTIYYGRDHREKMYEIPLDEIERLTVDQMRIQDSQDTAVAEKQDDMEQNGQENGVGFVWDPTIQKYRVVWGHTRFRAATATEAQGGTIPGNKAAHIWGYVLDASSAEIEQFKTIENTNFSHAVAATKADVANSVADMIRKGVFGSPSDFEDLSVDDQRKIIKTWVDTYAKSYGGRKFKGMWNILKKDVKSIAKKMKSWDKTTSLVDWFNKFNPYGLVNPLVPGKEASGTVVDLPDGRRLGIYLSTAFKEFHTNIPANTQWKKNVNREADEIVVVACFNEASAATINAKRAAGEKKLRLWNGPLPINSVDRLLMPPATELEQQNEIQTPWIVDVKL